MNFNNLSNSSSGNQSTGRPKLFGDVTLEIIDDFLNPINRTKTDNQTHKIKFIPTSESFGLGIRSYDSDDDTFIDSESDRYSRPKTPVDEYKYAEQLRDEYEQELVREMSNTIIDQSTNMTESQDDGAYSVVGSQMSQIESVSTMYMPKDKKKGLMKRVEKFADMSLNEEDGTESLAVSDLNNNIDMSRKMNVLANVYNGDEDIDQKMNELTDEQQRLRLYIEFCKEYKLIDDYNPKLPITKMRSHILDCISSYKFCIIQGGTGTG
jgi:hypothetical protein